MKRRKALKHIGFGVSAGLAIPAWLSSCKEEEPGPEVKYDGVVAVVGAGASGLYAADILQTKGVKVRIFEASDRLGGRIRSIKMADDSPVISDFPIELGADRILGTNSKWAQIIDQLSVPVVEITSLGKQGLIMDSSYQLETAIQSDADVLAAKNFIANISSLSSSATSIQQAIQSAGLSQRTYGILNAWLGNKYGTSNDRLGAKTVAEASNLRTRNQDERTLRSNPMQDVLLSRFSRVASAVEVNSVVKKIDYSGARIIIEGQKIVDGTAENFTAEVDKVIVTVPLAVLKSNDILFAPSLPPAKVSALSRMAMDASIRVVLDFKMNFWGSDVSYIYGGVHPEYFSSGLGRSQFNKTLSVTINGPKAESLSSSTDMEIVLSVLEELDIIFAGKATLNVRRDESENIVYEVQNWTKHPYIKGGVSYVKPGGSVQDRMVFASSVNAKLFFAGEATDTIGEAGTVNGALLSAERVAQEIVNSIINP